MSRYVSGNEIGEKLCEIFGIDENTAQDIEIHLKAGEIAHAHITRLVTDEEAQEITSCLEEYAMVVRADV